MKTLVVTGAAGKQMSRLPAKVRAQIRAKLVRYAETGTGDVKALSGEPGARLRVGSYRAIFDETATTITLRAVGHRSTIYK